MSRKRSKKELVAIHAKNSTKKAPRAKDFGDNPRIRHSQGEHTKTSREEPWERRYSKKKQPCPGSKIRSQGRGAGTGKGQGPIGRQTNDRQPYKQGNYTLHTREVTFKSGHTQRIYFFCTTGKKPKSGVPCSKPEGYSVGTNKRTGLPYLKKSQADYAWAKKVPIRNSGKTGSLSDY